MPQVYLYGIQDNSLLPGRKSSKVFFCRCGEANPVRHKSQCSMSGNRPVRETFRWPKDLAMSFGALDRSGAVGSSAVSATSAGDPPSPR
jgi:hypothetical protein